MSRLRPVLLSLLIAGIALTVAVGPADIDSLPVRAQIGYGSDQPFAARSLLINGKEGSGTNILIILVIVIALLVAAALAYFLIRRRRA